MVCRSHGAPTRAAREPMIFLQEMRLGLKPPGVAMKRLSLERHQVDAASGYAGSSHVLEMGRHYSEYVRYKGSFPSFPRASGFPHVHFHEQLDTKSRAQSVTGNIGEIVTAVIARRTLKMALSGITHLKTSNSDRTPDYLLRRSAGFVSSLAALDPELAAGPLPLWWPAESKATSAGDPDDCARGALRQLASYWYRAMTDEPGVVGYGLIAATSFARPRRVRVYVIAPADQNLLSTHLKSFPSRREFRESLDDDLGAIGTHLTNYA